MRRITPMIIEEETSTLVRNSGTFYVSGYTWVECQHAGATISRHVLLAKLLTTPISRTEPRLSKLKTIIIEKPPDY